MSSVSFGDPHAVNLGLKHHTEIGFDLDMMCTGQGEGNSCVAPEWAGSEKADGVGGRDNAVGALIAAVQAMIPEFGSSSYTELVKDGQAGVVFRVRGYNGQPNDDQVEATLYIAAPFDAEEGNTTPNWDGNDVWPVASDSLADGQSLENPRYQDRHAYVTNGVLVASLPEASIRLPNGLIEGGGAISLKLVGAFLAGKLVEVDTPGGKRWQLNDVHLGGRWPVDDLVKQMSQFPDPNQKPPRTRALCMDTPGYELFRSLVCSYTDIFAGVASPTSVCNALSFAVALDTMPAQIGSVIEVEPPDTSRCPAETDPANDSCGAPIPTFD